MCDLTQPKPEHGPVLCESGKALVVRSVLEGVSNADIRARLLRDQHYHNLSDQTFSKYRKLPVVKEWRAAALASVQDVGLVSLSRRIQTLNDVGMVFAGKVLQKNSKLEPADLANMGRMFISTCKEIGRITETLGPNAMDGTPEEENTEPAYTVAEWLRFMEKASENQRKAKAQQECESNAQSVAEG